MWCKYFFFFLVVLVFSNCVKKEGNESNSKSQVIDAAVKSVMLTDSLYKSESNRLTKYLLTFTTYANSNQHLPSLTKSKTKKNHISKQFTQALSLGDSVTIAQSSFALGEYFQHNIIPDSSYYYYHKATQYYKKLKDTINLQQTYLYLGVLLNDNGVFPEAELQVKKSLSLNQTSETRSYKKYSQLYVLATAKLGLEEYDKAIELFHAADRILNHTRIREKYNEYQIRLNRIAIKNNLAKAYIAKNEYEEAEYIIESALMDLGNVREVDRNLFLPLLLSKLGEVELATEDYQSALVFIQESLELNVKLNNVYSLNKDNLLYAKYNFSAGNDSAGSHLVNQVLKSAKIFNDLESQRDAIALKLLYDVGSAKENLYQYKKISEQVTNSNNIIRSRFARLKYESDSLIRSNQALKDQNSLIVFFSITLVLFFIGAIVAIVFRNKAKEIAIVQMYQKDTEKYYDSIIHIQNRIATAQESERKKFAKELHDGILNKLFVTRFSLLQLEQENLEQIKEVLVKEVHEVEVFIKNSSHALFADDKFLVHDFKQLIEELVTIQNRNFYTQFSCNIDSRLELERLSHHVKVNIYRILQEAFQNVQKYAEATICTLTLEYVSDTEFIIQVKDNGRGFDIKTVNRGLGLKNIEDRLYLLRSKLFLKSRKGEGTKLMFVIFV
ncbi:ATP-binding protein [Myroides sp. M-43]|uniref:sensor histidine kinase n=1 Tax=Myroides oncorhynchi TaxID=2893756 RepID=UPI001E2F6D31|nr:ATP-binding protein [Myroides oncorhynchi]MCC9044464.1 ATP-binding protein [Myroides oncorhynchi]